MAGLITKSSRVSQWVNMNLIYPIQEDTFK